MTSAPVFTDHSLWHSLRTRRRKVVQYTGADSVANRWISRARHSKRNFGFLRKQADAVVAMNDEWISLTDAQLDERITDLRTYFARKDLDNLRTQAGFAAIREVARRETGEHPFPVQIMGAMGMFHGQIVEMATGEGKTLTGSVAATALAWYRKPVHVITVNDYLAERDAEGRTPIYKRCGLRAGSIIDDTPEPDRARIYRQNVIYVTQKELVADWLRDQLKMKRIGDPVSMRWRMSGPRGSRLASQILVPGLHIALVDEIDSVLIDEAVTPLIIAQPRGDEAQADMYNRARDIAQALDPKKHFRVELKKRRVRLTDAGERAAEALLSPDEHVIWRAARRRKELVEQALVAEHCYQHGVHYQVIEDRVMIVDEYTGRIMEDRQWQHGLHQAVEAKHELDVTADRDTLASLSFQRFFKLYPHLCGMTGTAVDARPEMESTYSLPIRVIPTNRPRIRKELPTEIYLTADLKWQAIADEVEEMNKQGRPVLVGTRSVTDSEHISELLTDRKLEHQVLNAVHHKEEASIVSTAGEKSAIMVATNMAGRGTDIKLVDAVKKLGGLHVILCERHTARRIDRQLVGRCGRQGDPGSTHAIISLDDELIVKYTPKTAVVLRGRYARRTSPLPNWIIRVFDMAQRRAERMSFNSRRQVLKHDEELDRALPR